MALSQSAQNTVALVGACLASLMFGLEISSVPVILPTLEKVLHCDFHGLQWIMNAYTIACTTVLMATGTLADRYGRKRVFMAATLAFGVTSLLCGLAEGASMLIAMRFLQGLAGGAMFTCVVAILSHQFQDGRERGRAFSTWGVISGIGLGFGPIIGSTLATLASWQWVFLIHVPLTLLTLMSANIGIRESRDPHAKTIDGAGIVTLTLGVFGLTYLITQGAELGQATTLGLAALTVVSLAAFLIVEKTRQHPMFDFSVFRIRAFSGAILGCIGMNVCYWPFMIYLPIYFKAGLGLDSRSVGLLLLAYTIPFLVMPPLADRLLRAWGPRLTIPLGMAVMGTGFLLMRLGSGLEHANWLTVLPGAFVAGVGLGLTSTPVTNTTTGSVPSNRAGMASGIDISARLVTLAINIAVMGLILVQGTRSFLSGTFAAALDDSQQKALAAAAAAGDLGALPQAFPALDTLDPSGAGVHAALVRGFGLVMLYGGLSAWLLAALSFVVFGPRRVLEVEVAAREATL
ncbi:Permease of the major facilitator superfamily [Labilithrix luteola]|uniref:Permease of the major facilitator superfamily n=1 Tax=Labilithrix luteola TaxID=1391654 RepID=A0A0K1PQT7_9BACT|nr:MFS transporter [Labilithrix luteola]AKU95731.1 Permease of the major facilitator superfamily [Labilithrix luteola]